MKKEGFPPLIDNKTEIIVLGTMPSEMSIRTGEYYANPKNQFWKLIFHIFNSEKPIIGYTDKTKLLLKNKIGLWDILSKANREGSLDSNIQDEEYNDFNQLFVTYPSIKVLIFNGQKPAKFFGAMNIDLQDKQYYVLPSTSSANTQNFDFKLREWKEVLLL